MRRLALLLIPVVFASCGGKLSESQEYYVGRALAAKSVADTRGIYADEEIHEYVAKVGWTIALASDRPNTYMGYNFLVLRSNEVGAWAAPSGFIFITTETLRLMENEEQLAAVLAHEIAHVNLKHPEEIANKEASRSGVMDVLGFLSKAAEAAGYEGAAKLLQGLSSCVDEGWKKAIYGYGRDQEMAADKMAIDLLTRAEVGYNPAALADFLERLPKRTGDAAEGPYATHPGVEERIQAVRREVQQSGAKTVTEPARTKRFQDMTIRLRQ
jgi:predicted Zn-dependent protease